MSTLADPPAWESFLLRAPEAHLLQTSAWGDLKAAFGWQAVRLVTPHGGAQVLFRHMAPGLTLGYLPKGPVAGNLDSLLPDLDALCRQRGAFALKVEPDAPDSLALAEDMVRLGLRPSPHGIQPRRTVVVDLSGDDETLLARMHPKTRYNIRLASKKGVVVRPWDDLAGFHRLMQETGARDGFAAHGAAYYRRAYDLFHRQDSCELFLAEFDGTPLATLMVFARGPRAWYLYGASTSLERQRMPAYLLQWQAMLWARRRGCREYDLWGVPDAEERDLEAGFTTRRDGLWGVYRFKRGFGGAVRRWAGAWDRVYRAPFYAVYRAAMRVMRGTE